MYVKSIVYKIYSILMFVIGLLGLTGSVLSIVNITEFMKVVSKSVPEIADYTVLVQIFLIVMTVISFIVCYIEFSSMFAFAKMIDYQNSKSTYPMGKVLFALPSKIYKAYGAIIFFFVLAVSVVYILALTITQSVEKGVFLAIPIIPIIGVALVNIFVFVHYYVRFKAIGELMRACKGEDTVKLNESLKEIKPGYLHGYCKFYVILAMITVGASVLAPFIFMDSFLAYLGDNILIGILIYIVAIIVAIVDMAIFGCFVDNIGTMISDYQLKRKLVSYD